MLALALLTAIVGMSPASAPEGGDVRGNDVIKRRKGPIFTVGASARLGVLRFGGAEVIQPLGFGAAFSFHVHALHLGPLRLGAGSFFGHTRYLERRNLTTEVDGSTQDVRRYAALGHTDFSLGPSAQLVLGPVYVQGDFSVGLGLSMFSRPLGAFSPDEDTHDDVSAMLRGGGLVGIPIRNNQGFTVGAAAQRFFSTYQLVADPPLGETQGPEPSPDTNPFDLMVEVNVGYVFMF